MFSAITSAILQVGIVLGIAGVFYLARGRRDKPFAKFLGLTAAPVQSLVVAALAGLVLMLTMLSIPGFSEIAANRGSVTGNAMAGGATPQVLLGLGIAAIFQTSLSEELLFRGLIGKRLIAWLGFDRGNLIQAGLFGLVHIFVYFLDASIILTVIMVLFTGVMGWVNGWLNERLGRGSIFPGWVTHGTLNLCAYMVIASGRI